MSPLSRCFVKDKAHSNLLASHKLVEAELIDPAMSRLYYALFQAGAHAMALLGKSPRDFTLDATQWSHATICGNASLFRKRGADRSLFQEARSLREQADYMVAPVRREQVVNLRPEVEAFVEEVCA